MPYLDLLLLQNILNHATNVEWSEKRVTMAKGAIISADVNGAPTILAAGTNGYMLIRDDASPTGLKWELISTVVGDHTQNTDTGTTSPTFAIDSGSTNVKLKALTSMMLGIVRADGTTYADLTIDDLLAVSVTLSGPIDNASKATTKQYVDDAIANAFGANDAMIYKGTVGTGGTYEIAAFNALATYQAGWTYKVITAGTIKGQGCQIGDMVIATVDRAGTGNVDADWTVVQNNIDGAVIGPASSTDNSIALFSGTTGKLLQDSGKLITDFMSTWVAAPATKTSAGTAGQIAYDGNYLYVCTLTGIEGAANWKRTAIATNW